MPRKTSRNRNAETDFRGHERSNSTHASVTDPQARLYRKSPRAGAILCFMGEMRRRKHCFRSIERA